MDWKPLTITATVIVSIYSPILFSASNAIALDENQQTFLDKHSPFNLCVDPNFMPYEQISQNGKHEGIFADFLNLIGKKSGVAFNLIKTKGYPQSRDYFQQGKCDVIAGDTTPTGEVDYLASIPYFVAESAFAVHEDKGEFLDFASIADQKIGFIEGADLSIVMRDYPNVNLIGVKSDLAGIRKVATGELDGFMSTMASIDYTIKNFGITHVIIGGTIESQVNFSILVSKTKSELIPILNKSIDDISAIERQQIVQRWFTPMKNRQREYQILLVLLTTVFVTLAVLLVRHYLTLQRTRILQMDIDAKDIRFQDIVENSHDWIWETDRRGRYTYVSPRVKDFLGCEAGDLYGKTLLDFIPRKSTKNRKLLLTQLLKDRAPFFGLENELLHKDGHKVVTESAATPYFDEHHQFLGFRGSDRDVSERKETEKELEKYRNHLELMVEQRTTALELANDELKAFSYSVSHDLRTPLRAINGFSQIIEEDYADKIDDFGKEYLQRIRQGTRQMSNIIDAMLSLFGVSRVEFNPQDMDLSALVNAIIAKFKSNEPWRVIRCLVTPGIRCTADKALMTIAIENLVSNAWKYTSKKQDAYLEFGFKRVQDKTVYYFRDNGAGFDMRFSNKLFSAFQRLHSADDFQGTGIGLVTVMRIIRRHRGEIWADANPGEGACFYFTLNIASQPKSKNSETVTGSEHKTPHHEN